VTTGDVVFTSSALDVSVSHAELNKYTASLTRHLPGSDATQVDLSQKVTSAENSPFDVTKQYIVEVKEA
jgi:hypothetical protein